MSCIIWKIWGYFCLIWVECIFFSALLYYTTLHISGSNILRIILFTMLSTLSHKYFPHHRISLYIIRNNASMLLCCGIVILSLHINKFIWNVFCFPFPSLHNLKFEPRCNILDYRSYALRNFVNLIYSIFINITLGFTLI